MPKISVTRAAAVFSAVLCLFGVLLGRVGYLETYGRQGAIRRAERQQHMNEVMLARRGSIFDRNSMLCAGTVQGRSLYIDPKFFHESMLDEGKTAADIRKAITELCDLADLDHRRVIDILDDKSENRFVRLLDRIDPSIADEIDKRDFPGVGTLPTSVRNYPMGSLAAHILGGMRKDGIGLEGLELKFEKALAGHDGYKRTLKDARKRPLATAEEDYLPPAHGQHLILTMDANIQLIAEQELASAVQKVKAKRGEVVVLDPHTGEILALANYPTYKPGLANEASAELRRNNAIVVPYEPGSTIKPFIAGPALFFNVTRPGEVWNIPNGYTPYANRRITDVHYYGPLTTWDILVKSSNIGSCLISERMGNARLLQALTAFGFGRPTGVELPGEDAGMVKPLRQWTKFSTESVGQGYEVMMTPLQLARGFCAYANGGRLISPHIIQGVLTPEGVLAARVVPAPLSSLPKVLDAETAGEIRRILADVPIRGTASSARSRIYNAFGKTGTSHISNGRAGYSDSRYNSSFVCGAPYESPRIVVAMIIHEPERSIAHYGGAVSAPGTMKIVERTLVYMQVPGSPSLPMPPASVASSLVNFNEKIYRMDDAPTQTATARD